MLTLIRSICLTSALTVVCGSAVGAVDGLADYTIVSLEDAAVSSFEFAEPGAFKRIDSAVGTWNAVAGRVLIDDKHAASGRQCLQLAGGPRSSVELAIDEDIQTNGNLTFRAERWTKRRPFSFRIEKQSDGKWSEIYNGDQKIKVGRPFLSSVDVPLNDPRATRLRFTVTSPPDTGILIDDVRIAPARPQRILSAEVVPFALPALVGNKNSPLIKLKIETIGRINPISLTGVHFRLEGTTNRLDLSAIRSFSSGSSPDFETTVRFGSEATPAENVVITGNQPLAEGTNYVWVACTLSDAADITHRIGAVCEKVVFSDGRVVQTEPIPSVQQMGVAIRNAGSDGVHTYRIPGLATTKRGSLIAVHDVRRRSGRDLPGDIDVGMSRSTDGGRTWEPMKVIMDMGADPTFRHDGIGDPSVLVDKTSGTIWCAATWSHGNRSWVGSMPGLTPDETGQFILVRSDDDGVTWSEPINITKQVKKPEWSFLLQGPGKGITMHDGTIVFPAQYQDAPNSVDKRANRLPHSTFIYSRDHGKTWSIGAGAYDDTTEAQVVELADNQIMINCRYNRASKRVVMTTSDLGKTWVEHPTSRKSLVEPGSCMASLINVGRELSQLGLAGKYSDRNDVLLFSNPDSLRGRNHITIKASLDGGRSWPAKHHLLLDEQRGAGYSCMTMIDAETVGILYEGSQAHMTFQRIKLADILNPPRNQKTKHPARVADDSGSAAAVSKQPGSDFALARVFGDHMVLQADQPIRVWGRAKPGSDVVVELGADSAKTTTGSRGRWQVTLAARPSDKNPQTLRATSGDSTDAVEDVLIGEVWLCAGQSNMEWPLSKSSGAEKAIYKSSDTQLRLMNFVGAARGGSGVYDQQTIDRLDASGFSTGTWAVAGPATSATFSAVGYYFAKRLRRELDRPVGIINVSIGGTPIEAWISANSLSQHPSLRQMVRGNWLDNPALDEWCQARAKANLKGGLTGDLKMPGDRFGPNHSFKPGFMFDAAIRPFTPMSIRGILWYQGESNGDNPQRIRQYDAAFPLLVSSWRAVFMNEQMPFAFVQLPAMDRPHWPTFRECQRRSLARVKNVGMAITIDTGDRRNVHPSQKKPVGRRLAQWALTKVYGASGPGMGPLYRSKRVEGKSLVLTLDCDGDELHTAPGQTADPRHFEIAGEDGVFHPATARIVGTRVRLTSPSVPRPRDARYAWAPFPDPRPNLVNSIGIPASPFSTEN